MRQQCWCLCLVLLATCLAGQTQAGCGLLRRGGCSDPCAAAACGGYGASSCSSCAGNSMGPSSYGTASGCTACGSASNAVVSAAGCAACGAGNAGCAACAAAGSSPMMGAMQAIVPTQQAALMDCGPVQSYKVVMEPQFFTETKYENVTEYQDEIRYRTRTIPRQVAVEVTDYRTTTVMVPKTETKTVEYTVLVPQQQEKTVELVETVPVWNEVTDNYTVRVPTLVDVPEEYTVKVAQLRDESFTYTVYVPQAQTETKMQTVTNAVPVVKTRTIQVNRPVTRMQTVSKDYGHWEVRVEEMTEPTANYAAPSVNCAPSVSYGLSSGGINTGGCGSYSGSCGSCGGCGQSYATTSRGCLIRSTCGSCGGCGVQRSACGGCGSSACRGGCSSGAMGNVVSNNGCGNALSGCANAGFGETVSGSCAPAAQTVSRRVWVPNMVTEEVPVTEQVSEEQVVSFTAFEQETQQIPYECTYLVYAPEERTGTRKVVDYVSETKTRTRKVVQYNEESRSRTRKELSYKQETRTQTIPYVSYTTEKRNKEVAFTINVPETRVEPVTSTRFDTVNEEITEQYSVRVPVAGVKEVQVQSCRMVPKLVPVTIYPCSSSASVSVGGCTNCGVPTPAPMVSNGCAACGNTGTCTTCTAR